MRYARYIISALIIILVNTTCRDEFAVRDFPSVLTTGTIIKGTEGVEFSGEIIGRKAGNAVETGFIWQKGSDPVANPGYKMTFPGRLTDGKFNILINTSLKKGSEYFVRAYAKSGEILIYGDMLSFISPEDYFPGIISVKPLIGLVGDTINIKGGIFNTDSSKVVVRFNELRSKIVFCSDSLIRCLVPMNLTSRLSTVSIADEGPVSPFGESFVLSTPAITSFSPVTAVFNDTVSITGTGFHKVSQLNKVKFGDVPAIVISSSPPILKVRVPYMTDSLCKVSVTVSGQTGISQNNIKVKVPSFDFFEPQTAGYLEAVNIHCRNIRIADIKSILIDNLNARILSSAANIISVEVPTGLNKQLSDIKIKFDSQEFVFPVKFGLRQPVITGISAERVNNQQIITISGSDFNPVKTGNVVDLTDSFNRKYTFIPISSSSGSIQIKILNTINPAISLPSGPYILSVKTCETGYLWNNPIIVVDLWRKLASFPGGERYKGGAFTINGKGYAGLGTKMSNNIQKDLWEFDPVTEIWTRKADFPGNPRIHPYVFVNSTNGFVGAGQSLDNAQLEVPYVDFYKYNPLSNLWTRTQDAPVNERWYPAIYASTTSNRHFAVFTLGKMLKYTEETDSWSSVYTGEAAIYSAQFVFSINNKVYLVGGVDSQVNNVTSNKVWEFDTETNTMTQKNNFPGTSAWAGFSFSIGNTGYIGCGQHIIGPGSTVSLTDVYKYDPVTDNWTKIESFPGGYRIAPSTFVIGNKAYVMFGYNGSSLSSEVWEFYPADN